MAISFVPLFSPTVLTTSAAIIYTVPTTPSTNLLRGGRIRATNTTGTAATITLYAVPNAGTAAAGNAFMSVYTVPANDYVDTDVPLLPVGASIQGLASTGTAITMTAINGALFS
jgi:hypothetical protein